MLKYNWGDEMLMSDRIKTFREQKKITQKSMAETLGINLRTYQKYESGEISPPVKQLQKIATILGVFLSQLIDFDEAQKLNIPFSEYFPIADESVRGVNYSDNKQEPVDRVANELQEFANQLKALNTEDINKTGILISLTMILGRYQYFSSLNTSHDSDFSINNFLDFLDGYSGMTLYVKSIQSEIEKYPRWNVEFFDDLYKFNILQDIKFIMRTKFEAVSLINMLFDDYLGEVLEKLGYSKKHLQDIRKIEKAIESLDKKARNS